jgi:hypothetical protein
MISFNAREHGNEYRRIKCKINKIIKFKIQSEKKCGQSPYRLHISITVNKTLKLSHRATLYISLIGGQSCFLEYIRIEISRP